MKTKLYKFKGKNGKEFDIIAPEDIEFPSFEYEWYNNITACGAGSGMGDKIVPESLFFLRVTLACYVHDDMFNRSHRSWEEFHHANSVFLVNIISIVQNQSLQIPYNPIKHLRIYRAATYFCAVDSIGAKIFFSLQQEED